MGGGGGAKRACVLLKFSTIDSETKTNPYVVVRSLVLLNQDYAWRPPSPSKRPTLKKISERGFCRFRSYASNHPLKRKKCTAVFVQLKYFPRYSRLCCHLASTLDFWTWFSIRLVGGPCDRSIPLQWMTRPSAQQCHHQQLTSVCCVIADKQCSFSEPCNLPKIAGQLGSQ